MIVKIFLYLLLIDLTLAHPEYLECGGLTNAIDGRIQIMGYVPKNTSRSNARFSLKSSSGFSNGMTNYTVRVTNEGSALLMQAADNGTTITGYGHGICGSDPSRPGHGLCDKCKLQIYSTVTDCTDYDCTFGISGDGKSKATIFVATARGGQVYFTPVVLDV